MKQVVEIVMPQLAESLVSATIDKWLKQPGEQVEMYEPICDILTDKVNAELPASAAGRLVKILVGNGETVEVGTPICLIEQEGTSHARQDGHSQPASGHIQQTAPAAAVAAAGTAGAASGASSGSASGAVPAASMPAAEAGASAVSKMDGDQSMRHRYSPAVQQLAALHKLDLAQIKGTGIGGRITRKDVLAYAASGAADRGGARQTIELDPKLAVRSSGLHLADTPRMPAVEVEPQQQANSSREYLIDVTPIRNAIARNMRQSVTEIPHAWTMIEVDVTPIVVLRNRHKEEFYKREGVNLTYLAFLMKAVVSAIKDFPIMNSVWAVDKIIVKRDINISLAVGTEDSVWTPVIRNADQKNIAGLAREIDDLARKTREGKLTLQDMSGGTFTVNNTGSFGSILSYPIINYPQAAILTFESIVKKPVVINDMIAVRSMANLCLSLDHRILDGVICGRFLQRVKENLEGYTLETKLY